MRFIKGHGTENDFILLPDTATLDPGAQPPELPANQVRRLCDRHTGLGADGVLRVVPVGAATEAENLETGDARWFMDYRNADGSFSEMCGNGARLFSRYLLDAGLESGTEFAIATRGGPRRVSLSPAGEVCLDMGPARAGVESVAKVAGEEFPGRQVSMTNPHLVCTTDVPIDYLDLSYPPAIDATLFPNGANVEFVNYVSQQGEVVHVRMRVHERGVGETRSCGTGACAVATRAISNLDRTSGEVLVDLPGGQLRVWVSPDNTVMGGPETFVASGEIDPRWWGEVERA